MPEAPYMPEGLGYKSARDWMIVACVAAQAATLVITWPLWQTRELPPRLPQIPFGWILACSLMLILFRPRIGVRIHIGVLIVSCLFDQWRLQPQVIGIAMMMIATVETWGPAVAKSFLIAMWFWSGLHKLLSPDWLGHVSWDLLQSLPIDAKNWHALFAYTVAFSEILLGVLAIVRPQRAAVGCLALHSSIALFLSPWVHDWNISVIPWNLCTAVVGFWILSSAPAFRTQSRTQWTAAALLFILPAGFYIGWVDHCFAHVLYSDNVPQGLITTNNGLQPVARWGNFRAPFPHTQRLFRQYFKITAKPGWKLQVADPRAWLPDTYFLKQADGAVIEIDRARFLSSRGDEVTGVESDNPRSTFALSQDGARMLKRTVDGMIYAVEIAPNKYHANMLRQLHGLPNLEQLQLAGCNVADDDLRLLVGCANLRGIGLNDTKVTDVGIQSLAKLPRLDYMELENTPASRKSKPPAKIEAD